MTRLTHEIRATVVRGLIRKTKFKKRFDAEIARLGVEARAAYLDWQRTTYSQALVDYMARMDKTHRRVLCTEVERVEYGWSRRRLTEDLPAVASLLGDDRDVGYDDARYYLGDLLARNGNFSVRLAKPVWSPRDHKELYLRDLENRAALFEPLNALTAELLGTIEQLNGFLRTVTTVPKLQKLMPEAAELVPPTVRAVAVIPDASNAIAALIDAGYPEGAEAVAA